MRSLPLTLAALHWQYPQAGAVVLPVGLALSAAAVWAYVPQVRQVGRAWAWAMPGLRVAALGTLAVSLMRPAVDRPRTAAEGGPVVVLIDASRSMGVVDTGRVPGQRVGVAAALGRLPAAARSSAAVAVEAAADRLGPLADAVDRARAGVGYARLAGRDADAATARLDAAVDALRRAARAAVDVPDAAPTPGLRQALDLLVTPPTSVDRDAWLDRAGERARAAAAEAFDARTAADARLYADDPAVRAAADAVAARTRGQLAWAAAFDPAAGLLARLGRDIPAVAFTVGDRVARVGPGDGPTPPTGDATDLSGGVRVALDRVAAAAGSDADPPRAVVLFSDGRQTDGGPPEAAAGAGVPVYAVAVHARVVSPNLAVGDLQLPRAARAGEPVTCRATVRATGLSDARAEVTIAAGDLRWARRVRVSADHPAAVAVTWTPARPGVVPVSVRVTPVAGEATDADNDTRGWLAVAARPASVVALSAVDGWPLEAACASLSQAAGVRVAAVRSASPGQIEAADAVVVFGATGRSLTVPQWEAISRLVSDRGGGAVLVAGEGGFGPGVSPTTPLGRLLPFTGAPPAWADRPADRFRAAGDGLPLGTDDDAARWAALPALAGWVPLTSLRADARPLVTAGDVPLVVERRVGAGRVLTVGSDQTWRWRLGGQGPGDFDRFWAAVVRAAAGEPYAAEQGGVGLDADAVAAVPGQAVHVRLQLPAGQRRPAACQLRVLADGTRAVRTVPFRPRPGGRYELTLAGLPAGDYQLVADAGPAAPRVPLFVHPSPAAELADLSGDDAYLRRLADATGGQAFRIPQLDAVADRLSAPPADPPRPVEVRLWDGPYLYAGVLGLLTAEWALRKRAGLA